MTCNLPYHYCLQANIFWPDTKILGLLGEGPSADCYQIDTETAFQDLDFYVPLKRVEKCYKYRISFTLDNIKENLSFFKGKKCFVVHPLVLTVILEAKTTALGFKTHVTGTFTYIVLRSSIQSLLCEEVKGMSL